MSVPGIQEAVVHAFLVAEQQKSFRVHVETTKRVDILWKTEFGQGSLTGFVSCELAENAIGFVKRDYQG